MTNKTNSLLVTFGKDIMEDDIQSLISVILMIKHVIKVEQNVTSTDLLEDFSTCGFGRTDRR